MINTQYRKPLPGTQLDYFDARRRSTPSPRRWDRLPTPPRVHAENLVRKCDPAILTASARPDSAQQARSRLSLVPGAGGVPRHPGTDRPGGPRGPARRHRRQAATRPGEPGGAGALIVDHSWPLNVAALTPGVREEPRHRGSPQRGSLPLHRLDQAGVQERRRDPAGNGIMHQINLEKMSPVSSTLIDGVAYPIPASAPTATPRTWMRWASSPSAWAGWKPRT